MFRKFGSWVGRQFGFLPEYPEMPEAPSWDPYEQRLAAYSKDLMAGLGTARQMGGTAIARTAGARGLMSPTTVPQLYAGLETGLQSEYQRAMGRTTAELTGQYQASLQQWKQFSATLGTQRAEMEAAGLKSFWDPILGLLGGQAKTQAALGHYEELMEHFRGLGLIGG